MLETTIVFQHKVRPDYCFTPGDRLLINSELVEIVSANYNSEKNETIISVKTVTKRTVPIRMGEVDDV